MQVTDERVARVRKPPKEGAETDALIDENLRRVYEDLVQDDVPDRFRALLDKLREREEGR